MTSLAFPVPPKSRYAEATPLNPEASVVLDEGLGSHLQHLQVLLGPGPHIILAADVRPRYEGTESADPSPPPAGRKGIHRVGDLQGRGSRHLGTSNHENSCYPCGDNSSSASGYFARSQHVCGVMITAIRML